MMRTLLKYILLYLSDRVLKKYKPEIIGITGSVGKSSTKEAIYCALSPNLSVRKNYGNYNTEIGVPLTILGAQSGNRSILVWLKTFANALRLLCVYDSHYPSILILEMAADKPGDINYLVNFTKPHISVITAIGISHLEKFETLPKLIAEKNAIISNLSSHDYAILNADDSIVINLKSTTKANIISYGINNPADITATNIIFDSKIHNSNHAEIGGTTATISYQNNTAQLYLPNVFGVTHIYASLVAISIGIIKKIPLNEIIENLKSYTAIPGRLNFKPGINSSYIIDDTYNAAPASMRTALDTLAKIKISNSSKRIAILGDMFELGKESENEHFNIGQYIPELKIDILICVGKLSKQIIAGAISGGMPESNAHYFKNITPVIDFIINKIQPGDLILIKASRSMHLEKIVKKLSK